MIELLDLAYENDVITALVSKHLPALKACRAAIEQRQSGAAPRKIQIFELVPAARRKAGRKRFLVFSQDMHGKMACLIEQGKAERRFTQAPQNHWRVERNGIEAVGGNPGEFAVVLRRDDGDARGEGSKGRAELLWVKSVRPTVNAVFFGHADLLVVTKADRDGRRIRAPFCAPI